ncbi:MAG: transglycosylase SLT domain-containing protein [Chloroflexi bacterium]|nr:transglycosylase SLT domain-containing protein [Chloroflexota bacterium]
MISGNRIWWGTVFAAALLTAGLLAWCSLASAQVPRGYGMYGSKCASIQMSVWGPRWSSRLLAQIHAESGWRPNVCSAYACGLTQFTPATEREMERRLGVSGSIMDPEHACILQAHLMKSLARSTGPKFRGWLAQWHATERTYNGSPRNFWREWELAGRPTNTVAMEGFCVRRRAHCEENWAYPWKITSLWSRVYLNLGWPA